MGLTLDWCWQLSRAGTAELALLHPLFLSALYSPPAIALLTGWLQSQLPVAPSSGSAAVVVQLGVAPSRIAGDSLPAILLITDPWQLPLVAEPPLTALDRNRLALHETAATVLYRLQRRM
jgi:hypothetical protein